MIELIKDDLIIIKSKNRFNNSGYFKIPVSWVGRFVTYRGANEIEIEVIGTWFPLDPEIIRFNLTFDLNKVDIEKVN